MKTTAQFNALKEENKKLREELDEYHNAEKFVLGDDCPTDEVHCGCVVILKKQIKELEAKNTLQRNALTWIVEEASSDIYNQSEILKVAEQALI